MKYILYIHVLLLNMLTFLLSQDTNDTLTALSYFPLQIGNQWQYEVEFSDLNETQTYYSTRTVVDDTLMPNGLRYWNVVRESSSQYIRIDSNELKVMEYLPYFPEICPDSEIVIYPLNLFTQEVDTFITCMDRIFEMTQAQDNIGPMPDSQLVRYYLEEGGNNEYCILAPDIGIVKWGWDELGYINAILIGALVNGIQYGEFVSIDENNNLPTKFGLKPNYPNPFNSSTTIEFSIPINSFVTVKIYDLMGLEVETLVEQRFNSGIHSIIWNSSNFPSGVYFVKMISGRVTQTQKVILLK